MAIDNNTWGFSKPVAEALQASIVNSETEIPERLPGGGAGGGGGEFLFGFVTSNIMTSGQTSSDFRRLDGAIEGDDLPGSTLYDPMGVFEGLPANTEGYCIRQGGRYYAIQAKCPEGYL